MKFSGWKAVKGRRVGLFCALGVAAAAMVPVCYAATGSVDANTLEGKVLVGYQGWYRCPGDGSGASGFYQWFKGDPAPEHWVAEQFPDVSGMKPESLCKVPGFKIAGTGQQAYVFSSFPKATTDTHFAWMREYDIDGALMERYATVLPALHKEGDAVLTHAADSAAENGRVLAVQYDLTGANPDTLLKSLQDDWTYLVQTVGITSKSSYLKEKGKPVVSLWGLGFGDKSHIQDPKLALDIVKWFKSQGVFVIGGVPGSWDDQTNDAASDPGWNKVYDEFNVIQPWTVGRYSNDAQADQWEKQHIVPDLARTRKHGQMYMPVIYPGFSWHNRHPEQPKNAVPRQNGDFLWHQAADDRAAGANMICIAMFDELNEGTAILKLASHDTDAVGPRMLTLEADGADLPTDWYLQLSQRIAGLFHEKVKAPPTAMPLTIPKRASVPR